MWFWIPGCCKRSAGRDVLFYINIVICFLNNIFGSLVSKQVQFNLSLPTSDCATHVNLL